jgi:ATP diphosphatase
MAEEESSFDFGDVVESITRKLIRRHPHVFGDVRGMSPEDVKKLWDKIKAEERAERRANGKSDDDAGALSGIAAGMPSLMRALKLQQKASKVGFDWNDPRAVLAKIREEADEIEAEIASGECDQAAAEVGDLLFAVVNLARHLDADPDTALRATNLKFERRFAAIEAALAARGKTPAQATLAEMDELWNAAKTAEKPAPDSV